MRYFFGPWFWDEEDAGWRPPDGASSGLDLRPLAACGAQKEHPQNFGMSPSRGRPRPPYVLLADEKGLVDPKGLDGLMAALSAQGAAEGRDHRRSPRRGAVGPRRPRSGADVRSPHAQHCGPDGVHLAGEKLVDRAWLATADPAWPNVQTVCQENYRALREDCLSRGPTCHLRVPEPPRPRNLAWRRTSSSLMTCQRNSRSPRTPATRTTSTGPRSARTGRPSPASGASTPARRSRSSRRR